ncbi:hypothetical protein FKW77_004694 [Venturia effusa]|uniref:Prenyltransferase alpha-alpha toroid domain-containing protein n=1 Tax=Venturia effusa TaxID=50376 RepID=A0A517LAV2_9PEZI|nr:hypothetical protein FKW77_004694 [Venturia effusa]
MTLATTSPAVDSSSKLNIPKHIQYWKRCLMTFLPNAYQANDANRMMLAFFILSSMDLLDCLNSTLTVEDRERYINWVYLCQHEDGGFRGFSGGDFGHLRNDENAVWDPANVPATFFALAILAILEDDFSRVKRRECLSWLTKMQRSDGSFGETLGPNEKIEGGLDPRFGYTAMGIRAILRGRGEGEMKDVPDVDTDLLVECIRRSQSYDGGISESPFHEPHGGYTYCALSALSFIDRLPSHRTTTPSSFSPFSAITDPELTIHWLLQRQTTTFDEDDEVDTRGDETDTTATCHDCHSFLNLSTQDPKKDYTAFRHTTEEELQWVGFNGRCNKIADTCYSWWVGGSLAILQKPHLAQTPSNRRYLLDKTQHTIGGFSKKQGDPPDLYHAYLGLAALALMGEQGLKKIDATACFSVDAWEWIEGLEWNGGGRDGGGGSGGREKRLKVEGGSGYIGMSRG